MSSSNSAADVVAPRPELGPLVYGAAFAIALPALLAAWAHALDRRLLSLPALGTRPFGIAIGLAGALIIVSAIVALRVRGGGWPMSPYPPQRFVTTGIYALLAHPLYLGSILVTLGLSIALSSPGGVWIVTPVLAAACIVFVWGFEQERTTELFGPQPAPFFHIPRDTAAAPDRAARFSFLFVVLLPWYLVYEAINRLETPADALSVLTRWDSRIPVIGWTELLYGSTYALVLLTPWVARTSRDLRDLTIRAWLATAGSAVCYLAVPTFFEKKPVSQSLFAPMLEFERAFKAPNTALPAFHVIWAMLALEIYVRRFPRLRPWRWPIVLATAISCLTTGMHAIVDVIAGLILGAAFTNADVVWRVIVRWTEMLSGSRAERRIGPLRVINHGLYGGAGVFAGLIVATMLAGERLLVPVLLITLAIIGGAALWAQLIEGSPALSRPFGYYGGVIGGAVAIGLTSISSRSGWTLLAAYAVAAPISQALGRLRCIVQGCCHGRPANAFGVRVWHPQSRVVTIGGLAGVPLHPTAIYSIVLNLCFWALLIRMWIAGAPLTFIAGAYLILTGLGRFIEEHFRGEPQTKVIAGLRLYQWLSIASTAAGAILTTVPSPAAPAPSSLSATSIIGAAILGLVAFAAYGVDFPESRRRFARLS